MRYLGLDLGTKTLGVSMSDVTGTVASTYKTIRYSEGNESLIDQIKNIMSDFNITTIVLGYPKNMNNTIGPRANEIIEFKKKLENSLNVEVILQDERLSTVSAHNYMLESDMSRKKRKIKIDSLAANIILQTYLDRKERNKQ